MKLKSNFQAAALALALLSTINPQLSTAFAQGSLIPPGPPGATMLTLSQIEPRTPIASAPYTITQPGSYYLTTNLTVVSGDAITIAANGVALDLNGFAISSTEASPTGTGILLNSGLRNISIANGFIQGGVTNNGSGVYSGSGFGYGIYYSGSSLAVNLLVSRVSVSGCLYDGIYLGDSSVVENCTVRTIGSFGVIASIIKTCTAIDCGSYGIDGIQVSDCRGQSSGNGNGVTATAAQNCYGQSSGGGYGVYATTALNCCGQSSSSPGVYCTTAQNCYGTSGSGYGVYATTALNCYGQSNTSYGVYGRFIAIGCYGQSSSGTGLYAQNANTCIGSSYGTSIQATIANGCYAASGTNNITYKYNMP